MSVFQGFIQEPSSGGGGTGLTTALEVILTFQEIVPSGTAINIQTGAYGGQVIPPIVEGTTTITLPAAFNTDALIQVLLNGLEQKKPQDVARASATQVTLSDKLKKNTILKVRIFA